MIDNYLPACQTGWAAPGTYGKEYYFDHPAAAPRLRVIMIPVDDH